MTKFGKKVLAVDFDSQANMSTCFGIEDTAAVPITIGHLMIQLGLSMADLMTQAANLGTIGISDLGESYKYVAPLAQSMGLL